MATKYWLGTAPAVAQIATGAIASVDATPANNTFAVTMGGTNGAPSVVVSVLGITSVAATAAALVALLNASTEPYFAAVAWTNPSTGVIVGTAKVAGVPFVATISKTGAGTGTVTAFAATLASSGPNDLSTAANYSDGAVPITGDTLILQNSSQSIAYGLAMSGVTLAELKVLPSFTGRIGLDYTQFAVSVDAQTTSGIVRPEYRPSNWQISATIANLDSGGNRFCLDLGTVASTVNVEGTVSNSPSSEQNRGAPPLRIICNNSSTVINVRSGTLGVAFEKPLEPSTLATINVADQSGKSSVSTGRGIVLTTFIAQSGNHLLQSASTITTVTNNGATITIEGTCAITTLNVNFGTVYANASGTISTVNANGGTFNTQGNSASRTISTLNSNGAILVMDFSVTTVTAWAIRTGFTDKVVTLTMK